MTLMIIRLEAGRSSDFPNGSSDHGYEFIAPITKDGHLDSVAWAENKVRCVVTRFWGGHEQHGRLRHVGRGWRFDYREGEEDDEPFFKLEQHRIEPGAYLTIREMDGVERPFRIVRIEPAAP